MIKVYIASPYTKGDVAVNVRTQLDMADQLMNLGFAPFAPLYSHFQHMHKPRPYEDWIKIDLEWVKVCDCVLRLRGESAGADGEVKFANDNKIPVFYHDEIFDMLKHFGMSDIKEYRIVQCIDCDWNGHISECNSDTELDEFKGTDKIFPICPKCGGGIQK